MERMIFVARDGWSVSFALLPFVKRVTLGCGGSDVAVPGCAGQVCLENSGDQPLKLAAVRGAKLENGSLSMMLDGEAAAACAVVDEQGQALFTLRVQPMEEEIPRYDRSIRLPEGASAQVGSQPDADIVVRHPLLRGKVLAIKRDQEGFLLTPERSVPMGVFVNSRAVAAPIRLRDGDFVFACGLRLCLHGDQLLTPSRDQLLIRTLFYRDEKEQNSHLEYPCISRMARRMTPMNEEGLEIMEPPPAQQKDRGNLFLSLMPALAMILLTVMIRSGSSGGAGMIIFSVASMAIGAVTSVITYIQTGKETRKKNREREETYRQYIHDTDGQIERMREEEKQALCSLYLDPERELNNVQDFSADLFDRRMTDADFLDIRLGHGSARARRQVTCKKRSVFDAADELSALPEQLEKKHRYVADVPSVISARGANAIGVVGDEDKLRQMLRIMTLDVCTRQFYDDVSVYQFLPESFLPEMTACRFFPHLKNRQIDRRSIADSEESYAVLTDELYKELSDREAVKDLPENCPWLIVFIYADHSPIMRHPLMKYVEKAAQLHTVFIFLSQHRDLLPQGCSQLVRLTTNGLRGVITAMKGEAPDRLFAYEEVALDRLEEAAVRLAPVYESEINLAHNLSASETLYDMLRISSTQDMDVLDNWKQADPARSLAAPMGIRDNGDVLMLDLHEQFHGPHGLVAGTTGSGKSQVLISYVLSLALRFSPEDVNFCIIDFKGGDIVKHLPGLPHITGNITNLDKSSIDRSLKSINAEKNKRMRLFADPEINASNINDYTRAYKAGKAKIPLPHLIIIVDEFAELKSQYPEFMNDLISIARVGRSLGIHMILCTQKPAGVVDGQIWSNSDFKLCLRVQTKEDSNEVLKSPLASEIREPGRGYLQVGRTNQFDLFQSGYSGAPEDSALKKGQAFTLSSLSLSGKRTAIFTHAPEKDASARSQCAAMLDQVIRAFEASGMKQPEMLCQPPIPTDMPYEEKHSGDIYQVPVGLYDDPDRQMIHPLTVDVQGKNTLIVGASQMGKTNLLMTLLRHLASVLTPGDVQVYVMDYNALALKTMEKLTVVGGVITADDEEELKNLFKMLREEVVRRKALFLQNGVTSFAAYRTIREDLPANVVMIDNYAVFKELYEDAYGDDLTYLLREGPALGISFMVTCQQTAALTYRRMFFFNQRFALPLNDQGEYTSVLDGCRMAPAAVPGRVLLTLNKQFYEGQFYRAFDGESESERAENIRAFVAEHAAGRRARAIPSVPARLTQQYLRDNYGDTLKEDEYACGMSYQHVAPVKLDLASRFALSLVGQGESRDLFLRQFVSHAAGLAANGQARVYLLDDYLRKLRGFNGVNDQVHYTTEPEQVDEWFDAATEELRNRLRMARRTEDGKAQGPVIIFVINNSEVIRRISDSSMLMDQFNEMNEQYRRMRIFFLFAAVDNKPVSYSSPELLRFIRDDRKAVVFEELSALKIFEMSLMVQRRNARPPMNNEAFFIEDEEASRVKLVDAAE